jgi:DNA-binding NtrC family response regulator
LAQLSWHTAGILSCNSKAFLLACVLQEPPVEMHQEGTQIIFGCERMRRVVVQVEALAASRQPVLITGETGTGKNQVARAIHSRSQVLPFVRVFCPSLKLDRVSLDQLFQQAAGGTLFFDLVDELSTATLTSLHLAAKDIHDGPRLMAATTRDPRSTRGFFFDAFVRVPPLRERGDDIVILAYHFLARANVSLGTAATGFTCHAVTALRRYSWPGNVRQLANHIHQAALFARSSWVDVDDLRIDAGTSGFTESISAPSCLREGDDQRPRSRSRL